MLDWRAGLVLAVFAATFVVVGVRAYIQTAATWDEPIHLTAGYAAATGDFRIDPSHPPLLRMWAALPVLFLDDVSIETGRIDSETSSSWLDDAYLFAHRFMYVDHDADRLLYLARFMILLLGVGLGVLLFLWTREWLGFRPACVVLVGYTLEPNLLSHASLVTTDLGVTAFMFGAIYFLWRLHRAGGRGNVAGFVACCSLAVVSKFSGLLLVPVILVLLVVAARSASLTPARAARALSLAGLASVGVIWAVYGFRYLPSDSNAWTFTLQRTSLAGDAPLVAAITEWIDSYRLLPNAFTQGLFYAHASVGRMPAFLAGEVREGGWWYYFPAAIVFKTPLALLLLVSVGLAAHIRRRHELGGANQLFVAVPIVTYLGVAMASGVNIGLRHILPIYPFLLLIAAAGARELLMARRRLGVAALALIGIAGSAELVGVYPHTLTFFNQLVGGPANGYRYLADSNLGWGQNLKGLKTWMATNGVSHVNIAYFGQADPAYYGIDCTHLPGAPSFAMDATARPRLPGYVAISSTTLSGVYLAPEWRLFYRPFLSLDPVAVIGNSIRVYWVEQWPDVVGGLTAEAGANAHRRLADALLFGLQWPELATSVYPAYLARIPADADAWVNYGMTLVAVNRVREGMDSLQRAVATDGGHGRARLMLARALFGSRDMAGAVLHAEQAVALLPADADAHHFLGRVRAALGDLVDAHREFTRALEIQPLHPEALRDLARVVREAGGHVGDDDVGKGGA